MPASDLPDRGDRVEVLKLEAAAAWDEYLEACRAAPVGRYDAVEVWAWSRLVSKLRPIRARMHAAQPERAAA